MANQLLTNQELTQYTLMILSNNTVAIPEMTRDLDQEFGKKGNKIGDTIYVRKPARFVGRDGAGYQAESLTDTQVPVTINQQSGVDFQFSTAELYLSLDEMKAAVAAAHDAGRLVAAHSGTAEGMRRATAALLGLRPMPLVRQQVFHRCEEKGAEFAFFRTDACQAVVGEQFDDQVLQPGAVGDRRGDRMTRRNDSAVSRARRHSASRTCVNTLTPLRHDPGDEL